MIEDQHLDTPEMGDTVQFKTTWEYGGIVTMRGEVIGILKNGKLKISSEGKTYTVDPKDVFVLSKGA